MKKIIFLIAWTLSFWFSFAQSLSWNIDFQITRLDSEKNWFITDLTKIKSTYFTWTFSSQTLLDKYYSIKKNLLNDYNSISLNLSFLKEKLSDKNSTFSGGASQFSGYKLQVDNYITTYKTNISSYKSSFSTKSSVDSTKLKWAQEIANIDKIISWENLAATKPIDISKILAVYSSSEATDKSWYKAKIENTLAKVETLLADKTLTADKKYLYLSTKKAAILYLYFDKWTTYSADILNTHTQATQQDDTIENSDTTQVSTGTTQTNSLTWDMELFESIRGYSMYIPKLYSFIGIKYEKTLWNTGIKCWYKINFISRTNRSKVESTPDMEMYECTSSLTDAQITKLTNASSLIYKKTKDWKKKFIIKTLNTEWKNLVAKLIIN